MFTRAIDDMRRAGATVLDAVIIAESDSIRRGGRGGCNPFEFEFNAWLAQQGDRAPVKSVDEIVRSGRFHPAIQARLEAAARVDQVPDSVPACRTRYRVREEMRGAVTRTMDRLQLDALIYPTWSNPPRLIGDLNTPHGDNSQVYSPLTGMPAITVPMGYTRNNALPAGLQMLGRAFDESRLIRLAYGYEQATKWRKQPVSTPPLE